MNLYVLRVQYIYFFDFTHVSHSRVDKENLLKIFRFPLKIQSYRRCKLLVTVLYLSRNNFVRKVMVHDHKRMAVRDRLWARLPLEEMKYLIFSLHRSVNAERESVALSSAT